MKTVLSLIGVTVFFVVAVVCADMPKGQYLEAKDSKIGVILAHGQGLDPDSQVVGVLRKSINKELGFQTLSLQIPVVAGAKSPE